MDVNLYNIPQTVLENECLLLQELYIKGDDIQKLSVIQALPQLMQYDPTGTLQRVVPRIQQELPKSSCEFHIATSKIFKLLIEKQLPLNLTGAVIQGTESKDPVVSNAWIETLLAVIPILPIDQIKTSVVPLATSKSQPTSPVYCRVAACKILGKCASHQNMLSIDVKTSILPVVQTLCQDCFQDVRATMCSQLHLVAQGLGESLVQTSLLPSLVELASDDNMAVRSAAVASAVLIIPYLNKLTKIETIVPLIKQLCTRTSGQGDSTFPTIAREFGKLVDALKNDLETADCTWLLQFFKTLATKGQTVRVNKDNLEVTQDVLCREQCAYNLPAVTSFTMARISNQLDLWHSIFSGLANDSCYIVRKTTAACIYEVARILGAQCKTIRDDIIKLLRDDAEEVLQMLVPHVGPTLELFGSNGVLSRETAVPSCLEITRALLKCQLELAKSYNWRIKTSFLEQLESLPNCMPSDFIHQHFSPVILSCVLEARPKPVRSQASRTLLVFLRYNLKEVQRKWIRDNLITHLCNSKSCYTRHIYILACGHAASLFSNTYFKKHFFDPLLTLADDPVSNIRLSVVSLFPLLYRMLVLPEDRKLQTNLDNLFSKMDMVEKDKDVKDILRSKLKEVRSLPANKHDYFMEQKRREEEENKIAQGKLTGTGTAGPHPVKASASSHGPKEVAAVSRTQPNIVRSASSVPSRVSKSASLGSGQTPSDMSFLEQHFYIDAGVSLPRDNTEVRSKNSDVGQVAQDLRHLDLASKKSKSDPSMVSAENVNFETMSDTELKKLETSANITDDVKVNLRQRSKKSSTRVSASKSFFSPPRDASCANRYKRYSSVFPSTSTETLPVSGISKKTMYRRSLNFGGDASRIPVCIKKSQSNAEIKNEGKCDDTGADASRQSNESHLKHNLKAKRPKSDMFMGGGDKWMPTVETNDESTTVLPDPNHNAISVSIIESHVPVSSSINSKVAKSSGLPVPKRRIVSEARSK